MTLTDLNNKQMLDSLNLEKEITLLKRQQEIINQIKRTYESEAIKFSGLRLDEAVTQVSQIHAGNPYLKVAEYSNDTLILADITDNVIRASEVSGYRGQDNKSFPYLLVDIDGKTFIYQKMKFENEKEFVRNVNLGSYSFLERAIYVLPINASLTKTSIKDIEANIDFGYIGVLMEVKKNYIDNNSQSLITNISQSLKTEVYCLDSTRKGMG
jgi:hypothetical protein